MNEKQTKQNEKIGSTTRSGVRIEMSSIRSKVSVCVNAIQRYSNFYLFMTRYT